jgi:hypothetical protein
VALRDALLQNRLGWVNAHSLLAELCDFVTYDDRARQLEQLWIDGSGKLRVLDFAIGECPSARQTPRRLLGQIAAELASTLPPRQLQDEERSLLRKIAAEQSEFATVADVGAALARAASRVPRVSFTRRSMQGTLAIAPGAALIGLRAFGVVEGTPAVHAGIVGGLALASAMLAARTEGSATLALFRMHLETRAGTQAGIGRRVLRAVSMWIPFLVTALGVETAAASDARRWIAIGTFASLAAAHAVLLMLDPTRGLFERVTDTRVATR